MTGKDRIKSWLHSVASFSCVNNGAQLKYFLEKNAYGAFEFVNVDIDRNKMLLTMTVDNGDNTYTFTVPVSKSTNGSYVVVGNFSKAE